MKNLEEITRRLISQYPSLKPFIDYSNNFELLIAVILTAQTTDAQVNKITPLLFSRYPDAEGLSKAPLEDLEEIIRSTGFFRMKAKNIKACALSLLENHQGEVPESIEELIKLPGVGRKTANVVVGHAFNQPAIAVDTHFGRVALRLGITSYKDPVKVERQVKRHVPPEDQMALSQAANAHGRVICHARSPECLNCFLEDLCPKRGVKGL